MSAGWLLALQAVSGWQSLGTHEGIDTAIDPASVRRIGEQRLSVRIRGVIAAPGRDGVKTASGTTEVDCAAGTATPTAVRAEDADGRLILNTLIPPAERVAVPIRPGGPTAAIRDAVCRGASGAGPAEGVTVRLGETLQVGDVSVRPIAVLEDSRCPRDVACVWAGRLRLKAAVSGVGEAELILGQPFALPGRAALTLVAASPAPMHRPPPGAETGPATRFSFRRD